MKKMLARYPIGNPRRKWRQDNFILSLVNPAPMGLEHSGEFACEKARHGMQTAKDAGFNMVELCWASPEVGMETVRMAERLQMPLVYQDLTRFGGMGYRKGKNLPPEENDLEGAIRDLAPWRYVTSIYCYDEPILPDQRVWAKELISRCEELCPDKLPYTCSNGPCINEMADEVDPPFLSFDQYPFGGAAWKGLDPVGQLDGCGKYWTRMEIARQAADRIGAPYWFVYQGHVLHHNPILDSYTFAASRMMANAALLYGVKGLSCYIECNGVLDPESGKHGVLFEEQKALNRSIEMLGNTLMALKCQRVIHDTGVTQAEDGPQHPTMQESSLLTGELSSRISISELKDDYGNDYLMVLNRDYRNPTSYSLLMKEPMRVWRVSDEDGEQHLAFDDPKNRICGTLQPGCLALYRLQSKDEEPYAVEYYLEKRTV